MEWQLVEVGLVTTLAIWVFLFSPSPASKIVAGVVFCVNLLLAMLERERPRRSPASKRVPSSPGADMETHAGDDLAAAGDPDSADQPGPAPKDNSPRRVI